MNRSTQTKIGIEKARNRGVAWGAHGKVLGKRNREEADEFAESLRPLILKLMLPKNKGSTRLAQQLNRHGIPARRGGKWHPAAVARLKRRLPGLEEEYKNARDAKLKKLFSGSEAENSTPKQAAANNFPKDSNGN